jgi:hypothetical protein
MKSTVCIQMGSQAEAMTAASHIHATSRKSALTVHGTVVTSWLPRVYLTCLCNQLLEIKRYSTTHAILLGGGSFM